MDEITRESTWRYHSTEHTYSSMDSTPLILMFPYAKEYTLMFNVGPEEGMAKVTLHGEEFVWDFYRAESSEAGWGFPLKNQGHGLLFVWCCAFLFSLAVTFGVGAMASLLRRYQEKINWNVINAVFLVLLLPIAVLFLLHVSVSSSPFSGNFYGYDASIFTLVGRAWAAGKVPYSEVWDHKGPLTFFLYMVGNALGSKWGVFAIQSMFAWVSLCGGFLITKELAGTVKGILSTFVLLGFYGLLIDEGGLVEEFNLPFLMFSFYFALKYLANAGQWMDHPPKYAFFYGLTIGVSFCLRLTNCVTICAVALCFLLFLLRNRSYSNAIKNIWMALLGCAVAIGPFFIYFALNGAAFDMLWGTVLYNVQYAAGSSSSHSKDEWLAMLLYLSPMILSVVLATEKPAFTRHTIWTAACFTLILFYKSYVFSHYYIIALIFLPLSMGWLCNKDTAAPQPVNRYRIAYALVLCFLSVLLLQRAKENIVAKYNWIHGLKNNNVQSAYTVAVKELSGMIPASEKDSVIGYNVDAYFYLDSGIYPCYKYFTLQDWQMRNSAQMVSENVEFYQSLAAKWIVVGKGGIQQTEIQNVIQQNYMLYQTIHIEDEDYELLLYRKIEM